MLVKGYFVTLVSFEPPMPEGECASCGAHEETRVKISRYLTAPYCAKCARRTRFVRRFAALSLAIVAAGLVIVALPVYISAVPLWIAFAAPPVIVGAGLLGFGLRRELRAPEGAATTQQDAVRLLGHTPPWFFCSNRRFMERLVDAHGGHAVPGTQRQWDVAWSAITAAGAFLGVTWLALVMGHNGSIMVDNGSSARATIWLDGKRVADIAAGDHEKLHLRTGHHTLAWSTGDKPTGDKPEHERSVDVEAFHEYLYNPGATTCYWRSVQVYEKRGPAHDARKETADDGPLGVEEIYTFDHVDRWFETNPSEKSLSSGDTYATDYAIIRDEQCTALIKARCSKSVLDELVSCESKARSAPEVNVCMASAQASCEGAGE